MDEWMFDEVDEIEWAPRLECRANAEAAEEGLQDSPAMRRFQMVLERALEPFHEARVAVAEAIRLWRAECVAQGV